MQVKCWLGPSFASTEAGQLLVIIKKQEVCDGGPVSWVLPSGLLWQQLQVVL